MALQRAALSHVRRQLFGAGGERTLVLLRAAWPNVVGPELARRTEVVSLDGTTLRVRVPDAGWQKALHRMRSDILSRLYAVAGELAPRRLGFVELRARPGAGATDGAASPAPPLARPEPRLPGSHSEGPVPAANAAAPASVEAAAAAISDPDLRSRFLECAGRYFQARAASTRSGG